jgi:hypothetical protein
MELILALSEFYATELARPCAELLAEYASDEAFAGDELRQAAIWGSAGMVFVIMSGY